MAGCCAAYVQCPACFQKVTNKKGNNKMEAVLQPPPRRANLLLHCGAHAVDREIIGATSTPEPTATWAPVPHTALIEEVEQVLNRHGLSVVNRELRQNNTGIHYCMSLEPPE